MIEAIERIIEEAINSDFWGEDSILVDVFAGENNGKQLECESLTIRAHGDGSLCVIVGEEEYLVRIDKVFAPAGK